MPKTRIKRCESCGGAIGPDFYIIKMAQAFVKYEAVRRFAGMREYFQGHEALAEIFSPDRSLELVIQGEDANSWPELVICQSCFIANPLLVLLFEKFGKDNPGT